MTWIAKLPFYSSEHIREFQRGFICWRFGSNIMIGFVNALAVSTQDDITYFRSFIGNYGFWGSFVLLILYLTIILPNTKKGRVSLSRSLWELIECNDFNGIQDLIDFGMYFDFEQEYGYKGDMNVGDIFPKICLDDDEISRSQKKEYSKQKPLEYAIEHNMVDMVRVLVENGVKVDSSNVEKAKQCDNDQILQILSNVV